jgi:Co/Zn/Cd efflux system component
VYQVPQVLQIHELHVYALSSKQRVGSMHVVLFENADFQQVSDRLKLIMHRYVIVVFIYLLSQSIAELVRIFSTDSTFTRPLCSPSSWLDLSTP